MKIHTIILMLSVIIILVGCAPNPDYASYSNWNVSDNDFVSNYVNVAATKIDEAAVTFGIDEVQKIEIIKNDYFEITYSLENYDVVFCFSNDVSVAHFTAQLWHFEDDFSNLFVYEKYELFLEFVDEVTNELVFNYQGGIHTYRQLYDDKLLDNNNCCYFYHFDDMTGDVGYSITWDNNDSSIDSRSVILFKYRGLLRGI